MNYAGETTPTKHKCCSAQFCPGCLFFTTRSFFLLFSFGVNELGKANEKLNASWLHECTFFALPLNQMSNLVLWKQHHHEKQCWLIAIVPGCCEASPLPAMEVKHLESLGTSPSGDANEDRELPLTMRAHKHTHTCQTALLCQHERVE